MYIMVAENNAAAAAQATTWTDNGCTWGANGSARTGAASHSHAAMAGCPHLIIFNRLVGSYIVQGSPFVILVSTLYTPLLCSQAHSPYINFDEWD